MPAVTPTAPPPVAPNAGEGRLTLHDTLTGLSDLVPAIAIAGGIALLGLLLWFFRRRRAGDRYDAPEDDHRRTDRHERFDLGLDARLPPEPTPPPAAPPQPAPEPAPEPTPFAPVADTVAPVAPPPVGAPIHEQAPAPQAAQVVGRAKLGIALRPRRAGTNLTGAAVEYDVVVRNGGDAAAADVRLDVRLLTAGAQQDGLINALFAEPVEQPITPPFDLPAGDEVSLGGMGILPRARVNAMGAAGRELFVPVITVNLTYDWAGGSGQTARSFVIGIERGQGGKMGAFRLDDVRMHVGVGALEYTIAVDR